MPIPIRSIGSMDQDTYSMTSQATTTMTIGDTLPAQLVRKSARKGFTFNIMSVGPPGLVETNLFSALFGKNLDTNPEKEDEQTMDDPLNPSISLSSKTFDIDEKIVRLKLTLVDAKNYGEALCLSDSHLPLVRYIERQFSDYHKRELSYDRKNIQDKMIHCLFFFISPIGHGLSKLDLDFLKAIHDKVNIIPIIAKAEALTITERDAFKRRVRQDLERYKIQVYQVPTADLEDSDETRRTVEQIQNAFPFAVSSIIRDSEDNFVGPSFEWSRIDLQDREHSDFLLLKTMLHMQMPDLCEATHEVFYENYRLRQHNK